MKENEIEETERKKVSPPFSFSIGPPTDYDSTRILQYCPGRGMCSPRTMKVNDFLWMYVIEDKLVYGL